MAQLTGYCFLKSLVKRHCHVKTTVKEAYVLVLYPGGKSS
uniref:Uncharacterized protein n=1 Tax=Anguilla anguilla TaxID=7936 RepID=A0A0E9T038_ANGAN